MKLAKALRVCSEAESCKFCDRFNPAASSIKCRNKLMLDAAKLIEELEKEGLPNEEKI